MIIGITATSLTFIALIISISSYAIYFRNKDESYLRLGRTGFYFASALTVIQAMILMWGIQTHQFHWQYVFNYSSRDLSTFYLTSTFWAGQEGTFLLWMLYGSLYGLFIIRNKVEHESVVMSFMGLVQAFIAMILVKKNPFSYIWDMHPQHFQAGVIPLDGRGLNPLLQDPWMIIHPPILFIGYSSSMILFAFAMSALVTRDYNNWIKRVYPYGLFVALALGTGIILGGYWAYTTLGWGGYWAWDPVENSSLIPWLLSLVFIHGVIIQRRKNALKKTNIFVALSTFVLVLWGSFLTRSGVLSDFSVHSFSETAINNYLVGFLVLFFGIAVLTYLFRSHQIKSEIISEQITNRGNFMLFGMMAILLSAVFTFFGMSSPILTGLFSDQPSNVSMEYYNLLNAPIVLLIGVFMSISPVLSWKKENDKKLKNLLYHGIAAAAAAVIAFALGLNDPLPLAIFTLFIFAVFVNGEIVFRLVRKKSTTFGGYLTHVGIGFMLIGIIASSVYDVTTKSVLPLGEKKQIFGYDFEYEGFIKNTDGRDMAVIDVNTGYNSFKANTKFYWSEYNQAYMRNPSVHNLWVKDLYISPIQVIPAEENNNSEVIILKENTPAYVQDLVISFSGYEMDQHQMTSENMFVAAVLNVKQQDKQFTVKPAIEIKGGNRRAIEAALPGTETRFVIDNINVEDRSISIRMSSPLNTAESGSQKEMLAVEVTEKPLINVLWFGTFLMIGGMFVSIYNRVKVKRL